MSHFSRIKTQFRNRQALLQCLEEMGFTIEERSTIRGYRGLQNVDIAARAKNGSEIGFLENSDATFDMVADWWTKKGRGEHQLIHELQEMAGRVQQEYARRMVLEQTIREGFSIVNQSEEKDGSIRIVMRRWVP